MSERAEIGIIGGTGLYRWRASRTSGKSPWRLPSGHPPTASWSARWTAAGSHSCPATAGPSHPAHELNFRANVFAMKKLGAEWILSVSAVGSLKERYEPRHVLVPDQFIDRTRRRESTFFGRGLVAHVAFAHPFCRNLSKVMADACADAGATHHVGGPTSAWRGRSSPPSPSPSSTAPGVRTSSA